LPTPALPQIEMIQSLSGLRRAAGSVALLQFCDVPPARDKRAWLDRRAEAVEAVAGWCLGLPPELAEAQLQLTACNHRATLSGFVSGRRMTLWWHVLAAPSTPPSPQDASASPLTQPCFLIVIAIIVGFVWIARVSAARSRQRFEEATARHSDMSDEDIVKLEATILGRLHRNHGPDMTMATLSTVVGETYEGICLAIERLMRAQLVEIIEQEPANSSGEQPPPDRSPRPEPHEQVRLTPLGSARFYDLTTKGHINVNGDIIRAEAGAVVNNRATVVNSFNTFAEKYDPEVANALMQLEKAVADAKNVEAAELLEAFLAELKADSRKPSVLRQLFLGIQEATPAVATMTDVLAKVSSLFNH
jgi:hypothetical protein